MLRSCNALCTLHTCALLGDALQHLAAASESRPPLFRGATERAGVWLGPGELPDAKPIVLRCCLPNIAALRSCNALCTLARCSETRCSTLPQRTSRGRPYSAARRSVPTSGWGRASSITGRRFNTTANFNRSVTAD